jgi:Mn2+/Fe2+ NRAMP family transporter
MIPANEWWNIIHNYGLVIFPAQIVFYIAAIVMLVIFLRRHGKTTDRVSKGFMAFAFCWIGIVFFLFPGRSSRLTKRSPFCFCPFAYYLCLTFLPATADL